MTRETLVDITVILAHKRIQLHLRIRIPPIPPKFNLPNPQPGFVTHLGSCPLHIAWIYNYYCMYLHTHEETKDNIMDTDSTIVKVQSMMGQIKVVDNKELNLAALSTTPGESCANCTNYSVYEVPEPIEHNMDNEAIYVEPLLLHGSCTTMIDRDLFVFNIPSTFHCPKHDRRQEDQFEDDAIIDNMEGREV